jgi:hypothetical protein
MDAAAWEDMSPATIATELGECQGHAAHHRFADHTIDLNWTALLK